MSSRVFKKISVTGCSDESYKEAVEAAIAKAGESVHGMSWFEIKELRGSIREGKPADWQATVEIGFRVD